MSDLDQPPAGAPLDPSGFGPEMKQSLLGRYDVAAKAGGVLAPVLTAVLAFAVGGIVVLITTGKNPLATYRAIFEGAGFNWFLPWVTGAERQAAAFNMQQTLILTTTLILTGLAVAFAFRCGLFNIGGQGQYIAGAIFAVWIGSSFENLNPLLHVLFAAIAGALCGALWAGIAGILKATVGAHEVISTIMLNWIAIWIGVFLFGLGGPLQGDRQEFIPVSNDIVEGAKLPVFWGDAVFQGLHIGFFVAIGALVVYWLILNRTTLGYGVKAVGFNPEAAHYGGINVQRSYFLAMAISGAFAGTAGAIDVLGWQFRLATDTVTGATIAFVGIAVALLGRNTAIGVALAALLFGGLLTGTATRNLDPEVFQPQLASNLTLLIQGLVVLFVGADVIVLWLMARMRRRRPA
ncbi:MAG: ABC transporter permease [Thermoleophilia bacterium]